MTSTVSADRSGDINRRPLGGYRVVELAGAPVLPFGKTFADLGADVIKVEPPGGDPARALPPLARGLSGADVSLYWSAYSLGKRSVTADLATTKGCDLIRRLAATADVLVESFPPGTLDALGLGHDALRAENPGLCVTSITPFGQTGPYAAWAGSDLVQFAMGGYLNMTGPPDGAPIKPSAPYQSWLHACGQAVAATLLALRQRRRTGHGLHIDQAMRDTGVWMLTHTYQFYDLHKINLRRQGAMRDMGGVVRLGNIWRCKDGHIVWVFQTGHVSGPRMRMLVQWMAGHDMASSWLEEQVWEEMELLSVAPETLMAMGEAFAAFFITKTKAELLDWALAHGVMLAPVQTLEDVASDRQLAARAAWRTVGLGDGLTGRVPGPPIRLSDACWEPAGSPPAVGEHNQMVYGDELGLSAGELSALGSAGAI